MTDRELSHLRSAEAHRAAGESLLGQGNEDRAAWHFGRAADEYAAFSDAVQKRAARRAGK